MKKWKIILRVISIIFIILVAVDLLNIMMEIINGEMKDMVESTFFDANANISEGLKNVVFYLAVGGSIIAELLILYMGIKGFNQSIGKIKGTGNIIVARVIIVILIISILVIIPQLINGQITLLSFLSNIISVAFMYFYMRLVKLVIKEEKK